jgi:catechol 2,3-dioxygenase-like lactoylglutathione lyase family enzyme
MKPSGILETCLCVDNLDAAETFYRDVIGLEFYAKVPGRHCFFRCGEAMLLLFDPEATKAPPGSPIPGHGTTGAGHVAFRATSDEIDRWRDRLKSANVEIESEYEWPGGGFSIYFRDPSGNCLEFVTPETWKLPE